jgi:hypothetical protein
MAISTTCPACGRTYKVDDKWAGKKLRCKECGAVMDVPGGAPGMAPTPLKPPAHAAAPRSTPARPPAQRRSPVDDPFETVDSLLALEQTGEVESEDPNQIKAKLRALRRKGIAPPSTEQDDRVAPAIDRKKSVRKVGLQNKLDYAKPADGVMFVDEAYFTIPGEDAIDKWAPIASIGLFVLTLVAPIFLLFYGLLTRPQGTEVLWSRVWAAVGWYALGAGAIALFVLGIMSSLASVGVLIAAGVMKFPKPSKAFKRCATALSVPVMLHLLLAGIATRASGFWTVSRPGSGIPLAWWLLFPFLLLGILWLMLRLKPAPFGVAAGMFLALGIGIPALVLMIFASTMGMPLGALLGNPPAGGSVAVGQNTGGPPARTTPAISAPSRTAGRIPATPAAPAASPAPNDAEGRAQSEQRVKKIFDALGKYAAANGGSYPNTLHNLGQSGITEEDLRTPWGAPYIYERPPINASGPLPAEFMLLHDPVPRGNQQLTLFGDGRVVWLDRSQWTEARINSSKVRSEMMRQAR